jgi:hypothetical protein
MSGNYDNTNRGALFKNHPDYKGSLNVSGIDYWISAWLKESKDGKKYMSLSVVPKDTRQSAQKANAAPADVDSDIPF